MALVAGRACRLLLADEVGLGKTIQAGLAASELLHRRAIERVLILTPAGLRDQWRDELMERFGIDASVVDSRAIAERAARLPPDVNAWSTIPAAIASIEFVKRPEVLAAAAAVTWDLVVLDEAHGASLDTDRHDAAHAIARRAAYVLLVTATPHSGDERAYTSLCDIGSSGDRPMVFRRTRHDVGIDGPRRVHVLRTRRRTDERAMDTALNAFADAVLAERRDSWLAVSVLHKRALSSAWSLAESVDRRLRTLAPAGDDGGRQLALPLWDRDGDLSPDDAPPEWPSGLALADAGRERRLLTAVSVAARRAAANESKIAALVRLLRRPPVAGERVIVFTEYRDTLEHVRRSVGPRAILLHGGLDRRERADALARFARQPEAVLLATDAAGEGLNLHDGCRLVVNLELPWNPTRLEQRIGRVDRIGQRRRVHAYHLVASQTGEESILTRLRGRILTAQSTAGAADPLGDRGDGAISPVESAAAAAEAERLRQLRRVVPDWRASPSDSPDAPLMLVARRSSLRQQLGRSIVMLWRVGAEDAFGRRLEQQLIPIRIDAPSARRARRGELASLVAAIDPVVRARVAEASRDWRADVERIHAAFRAIRRDRERGIADRLAGGRPAAYQAGLFDRRAERAHRLAAASAAAQTRGAIDRSHSCDAPIEAWTVEPALVVFG